MTEISILQDDIYRNIFAFSSMNNEEKSFHISLLEKLLNKQKILYTRLSLSDDPEAIEMKKRVIESAQLMGMPPNVDVNTIFNTMGKLIEVMKEQLDMEKEAE
jgi:hypothetical protein